MAQGAKRKPLTEMTDDELSAACEDQQWEKSVGNIGCLLGIVFGIAVGAVVYRNCDGDIPDTALSSIATIIAFAFVIAFLMGLRTRKYRNELGRRYPSYTLEHAKTKIQSSDGPDWMIAGNGRGLPNGNEHYVEICLWTEAEVRGTLFNHQQTPLFHVGSIPFRSESIGMTLTDANYETFRSVCSQLNLKDMKDATSIVKDGFPWAIAVFRKQPFATGQGKCNLSGISPDEAELPVPKLAVLLWEAAQAVPLTPSVIGSCDFHGNVKVEEV